MKWRHLVGSNKLPQICSLVYINSVPLKAEQSLGLLESLFGVMQGCCHRLQLRNWGSFRGRITVSQA